MSAIDVSQKARKVPKTTNALDVHRLPAPLKILKSFFVVGRQFQSADEAKRSLYAELRDMAKNGFQKCFDEFYKLWQKLTAAQGSYFEGRCVSAT
ncbi:hypothetical protein TNCV_2167601 [Trichonephila clavipes]|nr:hypothetical protein TNCV_2167601 [Trichonephila clavipes]